MKEEIKNKISKVNKQIKISIWRRERPNRRMWMMNSSGYFISQANQSSGKKGTTLRKMYLKDARTHIPGLCAGGMHLSRPVDIIICLPFQQGHEHV